MFRFCLCLLVVGVTTGGAFSSSLYTNNFHLVVKPNAGDPNGEAAARRVARDIGGLQLVRQHLGKDLEYHAVHNGIPIVDTNPSQDHIRAIERHPDVKEVTQQKGYRRNKRGFSFKNIKSKSSNSTNQTDNKKTISRRADQINKTRQKFSEPNDPLYKKEWFLKNTGQARGTPGLDLNVLPAWKAGFIGRNITIAIVDDGVDYMHPDLAENYNGEASFDFNNNDSYPYPRYTDDWFNSHGTRCAGEVSAKRKNGVCGVGVAPGSRVAGLRMLDQEIMTDLLEAAALSHRRDIIDIYSASWGPTDNGMIVDGPHSQTLRAMHDGISHGRGGLGNIFVWASGNGGPSDDCNCDGYTSSMWTISINSVTNDGQTAQYDESCSSTLASTFSNSQGRGSEGGVATVDLYGKCTLKHGGTSAAAPEAAGVFALTLEANPRLTWRDMQHLVVLTSRRSNLKDQRRRHQWTRNSAGLQFNRLFGFGVLDAGAMVEMAQIWRQVPEQFHCTAGRVTQPAYFDIRRAVELTIDSNGCNGDSKQKVRFIEHVQAYVTLWASRRGDVILFLTSPSNTTSMLLGRRPRDRDSVDGFSAWPFMTTHMWGESPVGRWTLRAAMHDSRRKTAEFGLITNLTLVIHGTQEPPYQNISGGLGSKVEKVKRIQSMRQN